MKVDFPWSSPPHDNHQPQLLYLLGGSEGEDCEEQQATANTGGE